MGGLYLWRLDMKYFIYVVVKRVFVYVFFFLYWVEVGEDIFVIGRG